jgi:hypothetical protein
MSWLSIQVVRRTAMAALIIVVGVTLGWAIGAAPWELPGADGPRVVRQYLVAVLPALLAPALVDRLPEFSASLTREPILRLISEGLVVAGTWLVLVPTWVMGRVTVEVVAYEAFVTCSLLAVVLAGTAWKGLGAVFGAAFLGALWLLAGDTLAGALGFYDETIPGTGSALGFGPLVALGLSGIAMVAAFVLGVSGARPASW